MRQYLQKINKQKPIPFIIHPLCTDKVMDELAV